jgi:hypothetical protein
VWPSRPASQASRKAAERLGASIRYTNMRQGRNDREAIARRICNLQEKPIATRREVRRTSEPRVDESDLRKQIHASTWQTRNAFGNVPGLGIKETRPDAAARRARNPIYWAGQRLSSSASPPGATSSHGLVPVDSSRRKSDPKKLIPCDRLNFFLVCRLTHRRSKPHLF